MAATDWTEGSDTSLFREIEASAGKWAAEAGERLAHHARGALHIEYKGNGEQNPVSEADREAEQFLFNAIRRRFPDHGVIGEEGIDPGPAGSPMVWVVDPLDGTTNYLKGMALWCVSVGVLWHGVPIAGAIYAPLGPDGGPALFSSRRGGGARLNGHPIHVDGATAKQPVRLASLPSVYAAEVEHRREFRGRNGVIRTIGTVALEMALTACGALQFSAFWVPRIWDVAAGVSLVLEAGGCVMTAPARTETWQPLCGFKAPDGLGLRKWQGSIIAGNERLARALAESAHAGGDILAPVLPA